MMTPLAPVALPSGDVDHTLAHGRNPFAHTSLVVVSSFRLRQSIHRRESGLDPRRCSQRSSAVSDDRFAAAARSPAGCGRRNPDTSDETAGIRPPDFERTGGGGGDGDRIASDGDTVFVTPEHVAALLSRRCDPSCSRKAAVATSTLLSESPAASMRTTSEEQSADASTRTSDRA